MKSDRALSLKCGTAVAIALGYLALMTTFRYGPELVFVPVVGLLCMPIGERLDRTFKAYRHLTTFGIYLYIALFFFIIGQFSFLDAVLSLVMFIQVYLLVHQKDPRHYAYILLMSFFLLWAAISESPRPDIAFPLVLFVPTVAWVLTALDNFAAARAVAESGLPDPGLRINTLGVDPERRLSSGRLRYAFGIGGIAAGSILLGAAIFLLGPRTEAGVFGASQVRMQPTTGVSSEISLLSAGALQADSSPVMRVRFPDLPDGRFNGPLLWRVTSLDSYTGSGWQHRGLVTDPPPPGRPVDRELYRFITDWRMASRDGIERISFSDAQLIHQEIYLDRPPDTAVPILQLVRRVMPQGNPEDFVFRWDIAGDFSVVMSARTDSGFYLDAHSEFINPRPADLRAASTDYSFMAEQDLKNLTYHNLLPETLELVQRVTANATNPYDKAQALESYLSGANFEYTTLIPRLPDRNPIDHFILTERSGHCELYASALALMIRSQGIPARLVTGYRDGMRDPSDGSYTITNDMAHIWAEAYFPGHGWISFDPSPQGEGELALMDSVRRRMSLALLRVRMWWLRYVVGFRPTDQQVIMRDTAARMFQSAVERFDTAREESDVSPMAAAGRSLLAIAVPVGFVALLGYVVWRSVRRRDPGRRFTLSPDQHRAVALRRAIVQALRRCGIECEGKTAEELAEAAAALPLLDPAAAEIIIGAYNLTRFGNRPMSAAELTNWKRRLHSVRLDPRHAK